MKHLSAIILVIATIPPVAASTSVPAHLDQSTAMSMQCDHTDGGHSKGLCDRNR